MFAQSLQMHRRSIPFVRIKTIHGVLLMPCVAEPIPMNLGQDRGSGNRRHFTIAFDNGFGQDIEHRQSIAVDQYFVWLEPQALDRATHCQQSGLQNIERINLFHAGFGNAAAQRFGADFVKEPLSAQGGEFFGVGQTLDGVLIIQDNGRASGPRPASSTPATRPGASQTKFVCSARKNFFNRIGR